MARTRRKALQSAYERRISRYLDAHPGATRQEARGHKPPKGKSEYQERVRRYRRRHPGASREEAAGHRNDGARRRFLAYIREGDLVQLENPVSSIDVDARGRLVGIVKLVLPPSRPERSFALGPMTRAALRALIVAEEAAGALLTPIPSLDQRRLV